MVLIDEFDDDSDRTTVDGYSVDQNNNFFYQVQRCL